VCSTERASTRSSRWHFANDGQNNAGDVQIVDAAIAVAEKRSGLAVLRAQQLLFWLFLDDIVQAGIMISNSETGLGAVNIQPLIYRLVCSNGMVVNEAGTRRAHIGRVNTTDVNFALYSQQTLDAEDRAFVLKIQDTVRAAVDEARFSTVLERMRESKQAQLNTQDLPGLVKLAGSSFGILEEEGRGVLQHLIEAGDFTLYGLANAVTRFSQDVESYDRATKLEEIGYSRRMTMSPLLLQKINQTQVTKLAA